MLSTLVAVLDASTLRPLALVAGTVEIPLCQATALQIDRSGRLWVAEGDRLYGIDAHDYGVVETVSLVRPLRSSVLLAAPQGRRMVWAASTGIYGY